MKEAGLTILETIIVTLTIFLIVVCLVGMVEAQNIGDRPVSFNDHPQHASYVILPYGGGTTVASGEQISNFPSPALPLSLGEVAREYRIEHQNVPKSKYIWEGLCSLKTCCLK
jgi:hypothetical protein